MAQDILVVRISCICNKYCTCTTYMHIHIYFIRIHMHIRMCSICALICTVVPCWYTFLYIYIMKSGLYMYDIFMRYNINVCDMIDYLLMIINSMWCFKQELLHYKTIYQSDKILIPTIEVNIFLSFWQNRPFGADVVCTTK